MRSLSLAKFLAVAALLPLPLYVSSCSDKDPAPSNPTPVTTNPPVTTPPPPTLAAVFNCSIGGGVANPSCSRDSAQLISQLDQAIDRLANQRPDILDVNQQQGAGGYRIYSIGAYYYELIRNLQAQGMCAEYDGEELGIKNSNAFSEHYDVQTANGFVRRGSASYRGSCYPASFPLPKGIPGNVRGCTMGGSLSVACGREEGSGLLASVEVILEEMIRTRPHLFNTANVQRGTENWVKVVDVDGYLNGFVDVASARGMCAMWDGEEMGLKRNNSVSEHFDILTSDEYTRRGLGSYRGSCYPASF